MSLGDLVVNIIGNTKPLQSAFSGAQSMLTGFAASAAGILGAGVALANAQEAAQAQAKLGAVLASTGGAAGVTAGEVSQLANELMAVTNFGDDATVAAAGVLATFTQIKGDVFKDALVSAQDLSSVLGQDLQSSVLQIGKALNDPIKGITALSRAGVSFTAEQKEMIKTMVKSGDVLGAQQLILAELKTEFGGAAQAMADPMIQLKNAIGEVAEQIGSSLLPIVRMLADLIIPFLTNWGQQIAAVGTAILGLIGIMRVITTVQKAIAIGQALILSLGGPAGWATLAAGAALFAGATIAINAEMGAMAAETAKATDKAAAFHVALNKAVGPEMAANVGATKKQVEEFEKVISDAVPPAKQLHDDLVRMDAIATSMGAKEIALFSGIVKPALIEKATGFKSKMAELNDEMRILQGTATEASIAMEKMIAKGLSPEKAAQLADAMDMKDAMKARQDQMKSSMDDMKAAAKRTFEDTRTPQEQFATKMKELNNLFLQGAIDQDTFNRAAKKAAEERDKAAGKDGLKPVGAVGAAMKGSREALSSIFANMRAKDSANEQLLAVQREALEQQKRQTKLAEEMETVQI